MESYKIAMIAASVCFMLSACGDDSSSSAHDSAELKMTYYGETYTHSGKIDGKNIFFQFEYVFSEKVEADELCRDIKNEGYYEDIECSNKTVSFTNTSTESRPTVDRILEELDEECKTLESFYNIPNDVE